MEALYTYRFSLEYTRFMEAKKTKRLQIRTTDIQWRRVELLMEKTALDQSGVVNNAIKEKFDREIGELPSAEKKGTRKKSA